MKTKQPRARTPGDRVLVRGVLACRDKYLAWLGRHPLLIDAALVVVLYWLTAPPGATIPGGGRRALVLALIPVLLVPLAWLRRAPSAVFTIIFQTVRAIRMVPS